MLDRRRPLTAEELRRLAAALGPAARIVRSEPLLGGLDWGTYALEVEAREGIRSLVVRRFDGSGERPARSADRLWAALTALGSTDLPVPRPVLRDDGHLIGAPAIVMTRCEGAIRPPPADPAGWIRAYAAALLAVHAADLGRLSTTLPSCTDRRAVLGRFLELPATGEARPAWDRVAGALLDHVHALVEVPPVLRHRDFWFGNTLWTGDRVTGIVDWSGACIGDPRGDVAYARLDVHLVLGAEAAGQFQRAYERQRGGAIELAWWELCAAIDALVWLPDWVEGYHEVGLKDLSLSIARERLDAFIDDSMERLIRGAR